MASTLCKNGYKKPGFSSKKLKISYSQAIRFCSNFTCIWYKYILRNVRRDFRLPISALATVARKSFDGIFNAKKWFSDQAFYVTIADVDTGSLKSPHTVFDKYLDPILVKFEQNHTVRTIQNFVQNFDKKLLTIFDKCWRNFGRRFCDWNNCLMLKY